VFNARASRLEFVHPDHRDSASLTLAQNTGCIPDGCVSPTQVRWLVVSRPLQDVSVYLHRSPVDMRKSIDGLAAIVQREMQLDPLMPAVFVFCNRQRDKVKLLCWERNGFVLWYKRLEQERFKWLKTSQTHPYSLTGKELNWLLDGLDVFNNKPHQPLTMAACF